MTKESDGSLKPTCEEIDDIQVSGHQSTRRPYKALMIESLCERELWEVTMI